MKRTMKLIGLLIVAVLVLAACAPAATPTATTQPTMAATTAAQSTTAPTTAAGSGEKVTVTIAAGAVGQELQMAKDGAQRYMDAHPNVTVKVLDTPDLVQDRLGLYRQFFEAKSDQVDVYQIDVIWPGDLASNFVDLNQYGAKDVTSQYFPAIVQNNTVDGKLVAIPWFTDAGVLYYRTDLLKSMGTLLHPRLGMS